MELEHAGCLNVYWDWIWQGKKRKLEVICRDDLEVYTSLE